MRFAIRGVRVQTLLIGGILLAGLLAVVVFVMHRRASESSNRTLSGAYFSRADTWTSLGGTWTANATEIQNSSEERGAKLLANTKDWRDFQIDADLQIAESFGEAGLIIRSGAEEEGVDAYNGYFAGVRTMDASIELGRSDFGWHSMAHASFPAATDLHGWFHLHAVAVGCEVGFQVRSSDGGTVSSIIRDENCIRSGRFGLRSSFTGAKWRNLRVSPAIDADLAVIENQAKRTSRAHDLLLVEPSNPVSVDRYIASMRDEARKHQIPPGITPIINLQNSPGRHANVTIQGTVISLPPLADIEDDTGAIFIPNVDPRTPIKLGDVIEAHGTLISERFRSRLEDARLRVLWSGPPIPPIAVTAAQLTSTYRGLLIEVEGTLVSAHEQASGYELVLKDGDQTFRAFGQSDFRLSPSALEPGSRLRLRGNATSLNQFTHGLYPFAVITDRIDVISAPPWWSPIHVFWLVLACITLFVCIEWALHRVQAWHVRSLLREREELAFEMHDTLAQSFTGIAYQLQAAALEKRGQAEIQTHIHNALEMVDMSHKEASRTIAALRPHYRQTSDIIAALKELAERLSDGGDLLIDTRIEGKEVELPLAITDALFRVGQEAVTNAVQHANCRNLKITLEISKSEAKLTVCDDGRGISSQGQSNGLGIAGMKARASKIKARFDCTTMPSRGTSIIITAPLPRVRGLLSKTLTFLTTLFAPQDRQ